MLIIDARKKKESFSPTHLLDTKTNEWAEIGNSGEDWFSSPNNEGILDGVVKIIILSKSLAWVHWKNQEPSVYLGDFSNSLTIM